MSSSMPSPSFPGIIESLHFLDAVLTGDLPLLKRLADELLMLGLTIENIKHVDGETALHLAAREGRLEVCKYLVEEKKLDIDVRDDNGLTPLHDACITENFLTAKYLLHHGANPNAKTITWLTPLHYAVEKGPKELLNLLISNGAEINALSSCGTPLQQAVTNGQKEFVEFLLSNNADPNAMSDVFINPLLESVVAREFECMNLLLKGGADPNLYTNALSPLEDAAYQGWTEAIECLLNAGADPNFTNNAGMKPIEIAALKGSHQVVRILFPVTTPIPTIPDWSVDGIIKHILSVKAGKERQRKQEEHFIMSKSKGTEAFNRGDYLGAIKWYQEAFYCKKDAAVVSNQSLCWARLNEGGRALEAAYVCSCVRPDWPKTYYRKGAALMLLKRFKAAADAFFKAWEMDPDRKEIERAYWEAIGAYKNKLQSEREAIEAQKNKLRSEREAIEAQKNQTS